MESFFIIIITFCSASSFLFLETSAYYQMEKNIQAAVQEYVPLL
jgi:hypothetical protein